MRLPIRQGKANRSHHLSIDMPFDHLTDMLTGDDAAADDAVVLYECRHCGTKFEKPRKQCPVCDATEIATYEFERGENLDDDADGLDGDEENRDEDADGLDEEEENREESEEEEADEAELDEDEGMDGETESREDFL